MMRSIKSWLHDHPYSYALFYFIPYLIIFELLETFVVPKYYICLLYTSDAADE